MRENSQLRRRAQNSLRRLGIATVRSLALVVPLGLFLQQATAWGAFSPSAEGASVAAATDHQEATMAALDAMSQGGNAIDGAIAAALVLGVASPSGSGLGGGGFALVYSARDKKVTALDFREAAPAALEGEKLLTSKGAGRGVAVGIPGEPAGLEWLQKKFAKRSLADDAKRAVTLAEDGVYVSRHLADAAQKAGSRIAPGTELGLALLPLGQPAAFASKIRRPDLAATLRSYGREGSRAIYTGKAAERIAQTVKDAGGSMTVEDLASYKVIERAPLSRTVDGKTVYTMPAPSAGGLMLLETLLMHGTGQGSALATAGMGSSNYYHLLAETMRGAIADRARLAGDPLLVPDVDAAYARALEPAQLAARKARIDANKTLAPTDFQTREQGTTHLIVTDQEGNVVSLTTTVNAAFGSGLTVRGMGLLLNDELDDFSSADDVRGFGVIGLGPNRPQPKARPVSSMTPTIITDANGPILVAGGSGGTRIATGVTQAVLGRMLWNLDPMAAVSMPRIHVGLNQGILLERDVPDDVRKALEAKGERPLPESGTAAIHMIAFEREGAKTRILAGADPRKGSFAAAR